MSNQSDQSSEESKCDFDRREALDPFYEKSQVDEFERVSNEVMKESRRKFFHWAATNIATKPIDILDVGCGIGEGLIILRELFPASHLVGIDLSEEMLKRCSKRHIPDSRIIGCSASDIESIGATFDLITSFSSIRLWENPTMGIEALLRTLRPHGSLYIFDFLKLHHQDVFMPQSENAIDTSDAKLLAFITTQYKAALSESDLMKLSIHFEQSLQCKLLPDEVSQRLYSKELYSSPTERMPNCVRPSFLSRGPFPAFILKLGNGYN